MWKPFVCFFLFFSLVAGCSFTQKQKKAENNTTENDRIKYQHLSTQSINNNQRGADLSSQTQTVGVEVNTAKKIIRSYKEYNLVSVSINGNNMWVTAHTKNRMSVHERMKREAAIHKKLKRALPQYRINVKLEEK